MTQTSKPRTALTEDVRREVDSTIKTYDNEKIALLLRKYKCGSTRALKQYIREEVERLLAAYQATQRTKAVSVLQEALSKF